MTPQLRPHAKPSRNTPIAGVLLTNADLDHTLGLILMRQQQTPIAVHASEEIRTALRWIEVVLEPFGGIEWHNTSGKFRPLTSEILCRTLPLNRSLAFQFRDAQSGATILIAPAVDQITDELRAAVNESDVVLFDGTFWTNDELRAVKPNARAALEMHHLPISDGSFEFLRNAPPRRKIYTHINNTNPILSPGSKQRSTLEQAGMEIARDGLEIIL
jgi:pyrroloquinoline quinone biosynthesis protein B